MSDEINEHLDGAKDSPQRTSDSVATEVDDGRAGLVEQDRQHLEHLKSGGKSGITDEFGKPLLVDSDELEVALPGDPPVQTNAEFGIFSKPPEEAKTGIGDKVRELVEKVNEEHKDKQRERLEKLAEERFKDNPDALKKFKEDMDEFERRAREGTPPLPPMEVAKTYDAVSRMLEHPGDKPTVGFERDILAQQVMHQAARPTEVRQGQHPTCNVATVESRLYSRNPSDVANMLADVATKGEYTTKPPEPGKPVTVKLDENSLHPQGEASVHPPQGADRSYASQIFQVTAANIAWEKWNQRQNPPGQMRFEQHEESQPGATPHDSGGRIVDYSDPKNPKIVMDGGSPKTHPGVTGGEMVDVMTEITGESQEGMVITSNKFGEKNTAKVASAEELDQKLKEAKEQGKLPIIVHVHTGKEPFLTDSGHGAAGGSGGWHVVNVTDYQEGPPPMVKIDNQWGEESDHLRDDNMVSVSDLHKSMTSPYQDLKDEIKARQAEGRSSTDKELDLLKMDRDAGDVKGDEYNERLAQIIAENERKWTETVGPPTEETQADRERDVAKIMETLNSLPPAERRKVMKLVEQEQAKTKGH